MAAIAQGSLVFVPDDQECFLAARAETKFERGAAGTVTLLDTGRKVKLSGAETKNVREMGEQSLEPLDDMVELKQLDEASILHNLRTRFAQDKIYTSIGSILVSVNPFKVLPIYSPEIVDKYIQQGARQLSPHVYGVADNAYRALVELHKSQSCIVSGESGAGKTEATKLFLQYLSEKSSGATSASSNRSSSAQLSEQILEANPLMEAFGNAKTVRNDNSSRFGKLIEVHFDNKKGNIVGGSITSYLLEKSRLVQHAEGERNYHIFYQLCSAATMDPQMAQFDLVEADQYYYLNQSQESSTVVPGINDFNEWNNTVQAMEVIGINGEDRMAVIRALAGILHLGNIRFTGTDEKSAVENKDMLARAADQLGTDVASLERALCMRNRGNAKESVYANQGVEQAGDSRDALAKAIYSMLFDWLIAQVNSCLAHQLSKGKGDDSSTIGVLDIFGFESFVHNSFEQLCINYCNEKLQGHFNEHIFRLEQEEYKKEGVDVSKITFVDNSAVLTVLEQRKTGIFGILDEENRLPRGSDDGFLKKVNDKANKGGDDVLLKPDVKAQRSNKDNARYTFTVVHYAGKVAYDTRGFLEKNKDLLLADLAQIGLKSSFKFLAKLFKGAGASTGGNKKTIGTQFREQLATLMDTLSSTQPHYIRCIKPNTRKVGNLFDAPMCLDQLRYAGLLEVCRIRQTGYPVRRTFKEFERRYAPLAPNAKSGTFKDVVGSLTKDGLLDNNEFQTGTSKVFLRQAQYNDLEEALDRSLSKYATIIQRIARGFIARRRFRRFRLLLDAIEKAQKARDEKALEKALLNAGTLPYQGRYLPQVQDAKMLLDRLREERRVGDMLEEAMSARDLSAIQSALKAANKLGMSKADVVKRAEKMVKSIEQQKAAANVLREAVAKRDIAALAAAIKAADKLDMSDSADYKDAAALHLKLQEETKAIADLQKAIDKKDVVTIKLLLPRMAELGLEDHQTTKVAQEVAKAEAKRSEAAELQRQQFLVGLERAMDERDLLALEKLSVQAIELGIKDPAVAEANRLRQELSKKADAVSNLTAEMKTLEIKSKSHDGIAEADIAALSAAIESAHAQGIDKAEEEMSEAIKFEARMHKQIAVQKEVAAALKDNSDKALTSVMAKIQEIGLETGEAKKVISEVRARSAEKSRAERAAAIKKRDEAHGQLREATPEERMEESLNRISRSNPDAHAERIKEASNNSLYHFEKFYRIRSDEDYTEHIPEVDKADVAYTKLRYTSKALPKSILDLDPDLSKIAIQNHKAILQYCGDFTNSFPAAMAGYLLVRGQETPELADEIYLQLIKQLIDNPKPFSADRCWGLMCMSCRAFPPTSEFEPFLLNFFINHRTYPGLVGNYARLCLVLLDGTIELGPSDFLPDMEGIEAYSARPPIIAEVTCQDGSILNIPVAPDQDVGFVLDICNQSAQVPEEEQQLFSIFVIDGKQRSTMDLRTRLIRFYKKWNPSKLQYVDYFCSTWTGNEETLFSTLSKKYGEEPSPDEDLDASTTKRAGTVNKRGSRSFLKLPVTAARNAAKMLGIAMDGSSPAPAPETPWPLPWWAFPGDVYLRLVKQGRQPILSHKRMIVFDDERITPQLFNQLREEVRNGDLPLASREDMAFAVALDLAISNNGKTPDFKPRGKSFQDSVVEILPRRMLQETPSAEGATSAAEWDNLVKEVFMKQNLPTKVDALGELYVDCCKRSPVFGMCFFYAQPYQAEEPVALGVDIHGVHVLDKDRTKVIADYEFSHIAKFGASGTYFWMLVVNDSGQTTTIYFRTITPWAIYSCVYSTTHVAAERKNLIN